MTKPLAGLAAAATLVATTARADEPLLAPGTAEKRLVEASDARLRDVATVTAFAEAPQVAAALDAAGLDRARVSASVAALGDQDLREIAARVAALESDPVAGAAFTGKQVGLVAGLILIIVFVIIIA